MKIIYSAILRQLLDFLLPYSEQEKLFLSMTTQDFMEKAMLCRDLPQQNAKAIFSYKDPLVKSAVWFLKYKQNQKALELMSEIMANTLEEWLQDLAMFENLKTPMLISVPMSRNRQKERGGNHIEPLCEKIMASLPKAALIYENRALRKVRETNSQVKTKNRAKRFINLKGSFCADGNLVRNKNIILIDDVITTGATFEECRRALKTAGANKVLMLAFAH